jgi:predicted metalloprotease with PDZ domain
MNFTRILLAFCLCLGQTAAWAQQNISYTLAFPNAQHHEAEIRVVFPALPTGTFSVRMARSSPGRYALHEFAKNVYNVKAFNGQGKELTLLKMYTT